MSIQMSSKYDASQPFHVYYDLDIVNNDTTGTNPPPILRFNEIRNSPYLMSPENYFMTVARFTLMTPSLPSFIPQVELGQADVNRTIYTFTMTQNVTGFGVVEFQQHVKYVPTDLSQPTPTPPLTFQDITSDYYFMYGYQQWNTQLNIALQECYDGLKALVEGKGDTMSSPYAPFFEFDPATYRFILNADQIGYDNAVAEPIHIYCNSPLYTILSSFQFIRYGYQNITNGKNYRFVVNSNHDTNVFVLKDYTAIQMFQESSTVGLMNPIQSLVFTTAMLPVVPELVSLPKVFNSDSKLFNTGNNANIAPILTDFQVPFAPDNTYKPTIEYSPPGEYRLADLYGTSPLSAIELTVFWKDQFANLHPFTLGAGCSGNIKILFRRKDFNTASLYKSI